MATLARFDPFPRDTPPDERSQTALAELATLAHQLGRRAAFARDARVARCLDLLERVYREPLLHEFPFRHEPRALVGHLALWVALRGRGSEAIVPRARLQGLLDAGGALADAREPYRALELRYFAEAAGLRHGLPAEADLFARTLLGGDLSDVATDARTAYAVTHTLFYATDYGLARPGYLTGHRRADVLQVLRLLLQAALGAEHWDLTGELVLCHRCLTRDEHPLLAQAWGALDTAQDPHGMICHPPRFLEALAGLPRGEPRDAYLFLRCHHMTLVAVMAGFLGLPEA